MAWTVDQALALAPDAASATAGRGLASAAKWQSAGLNEESAWGEAKGSGAKPYQTVVALVDGASKCSCPSRKFPCKHALALLLLWSSGSPVVGEVAAGTDGDAAASAREWAEQRAGRAPAPAAAAAPPRRVDEAARAKRLAERARLMDAGVEDLALWLVDLVRGGTAEARRRPWSWWDAAAARLVDAQLPGLAEQVRETGATLAGRDDWADLLLHDLGRWWTVVHAWRRRASLDPRTVGDLRTVVGWAVPTDEVRGADDATDRWQVLGAHRSDDGRLLEQRTWLRGLTSGEVLVVLDFAARAQPLPAARLVGSVLEATVARYPGSSPRRALLGEDATVVGTERPLPAGIDLDEAHRELAAAWATNPWARRVPVVLEAAALSVRGGEVRDAAGRVVPLLGTDDTWTLAALTGGRPARVFGELEPRGFRPLTVDVGAPVGAR